MTAEIEEPRAQISAYNCQAGSFSYWFRRCRDFVRTRTYRPRESTRVDGGFNHARAEEIAGSLWQHRALDGAGFVAHTPREIAQAEAKGGALEIVPGGARENGLDFANACVLTSGKTEVLPRRMAGTHGA